MTAPPVPTERRVAHLVLGVGLLTLSAVFFLGPAWGEAGAGWRAVQVAAVLAIAVGLALDVRYRRRGDLRRTAGGTTAQPRP